MFARLRWFVRFASFAVLAVAVWAVRRTADPARRVFVLVSATVLVTPYAFNYDLPALSAVILWQLCGSQNHAPGRTVVLNVSP